MEEESKKKKRKILFLIILGLIPIILVLTLLFTKKHVNVHKHVKRSVTIKIHTPQRAKINGDRKANEKKDKIESYSKFCDKNGIVFSDEDIYQKIYDLDHNGFDCDEKTKVVKKFNKDNKTKLLSLYDYNDKTEKNLFDKNKIKTISYNQVYKPVVKTPVQTPIDTIKVNIATVKQTDLQTIPDVKPQIPVQPQTPVKTDQPQVPVQSQTAPDVKKPTQKDLKQQTKDEVNFIVNAVNTLAKTNFKSTFSFNMMLNDVIPNLNIKINEFNESSNKSLLDKLENVTATITIGNKQKTLSIKDIVLTHHYSIVYKFNDIELTQEQLDLYNKWKVSSDVDKPVIEQQLTNLGITDLTAIKEEKVQI